MRTPSDPHVLWAWWNAALYGRAPDTPDEPQCGLFKARDRENRWCAASIHLEAERDDETGELVGDERLVCLIDGVERDAAQNWPFLAAHPISEAEHARLLARPKVSDLTREVIV